MPPNTGVAADLDAAVIAGAPARSPSSSCASRSRPSSSWRRPPRALASGARSRSSGRAAPREVRQAGQAFVDMESRIARHVEQRTAMLAGVSHDLRTILTRFKLELAFLGDGPKVKPLKEDVEEMQRMLEAYMAFVRGDGGEKTRSRQSCADVQLGCLRPWRGENPMSPSMCRMWMSASSPMPSGA